MSHLTDLKAEIAIDMALALVTSGQAPGSVVEKSTVTASLLVDCMAGLGWLAPPDDDDDPQMN